MAAGEDGMETNIQEPQLFTLPSGQQVGGWGVGAKRPACLEELGAAKWVGGKPRWGAGACTIGAQ